MDVIFTYASLSGLVCANGARFRCLY